MQFTVSTEIDASPDKVWAILGDDYSNIFKWTSQVESSHGPEQVGVGDARVCVTPSFGDTTETVVSYDAAGREFAFELKGEKQPFFIRDIVNTWSVESDGNGNSITTINANIDLLPVFEQLMAGRMEKRLRNQGDILLEELKYYAEHDEPHPRKQRQLREKVTA